MSEKYKHISIRYTYTNVVSYCRSLFVLIWIAYLENARLWSFQLEIERNNVWNCHSSNYGSLILFIKFHSTPFKFTSAQYMWRKTEKKKINFFSYLPTSISKNIEKKCQKKYKKQYWKKCIEKSIDKVYSTLNICS